MYKLVTATFDLYTVQNHITIRIKVRSGEFMGVNNFCINRSNLRAFIKDLSGMKSALKGDTKISDYDSDSIIYFKMEKNGHLKIKGQLGGSKSEQFVKFKAINDQGMLDDLIQYLDRTKDSEKSQLMFSKQDLSFENPR